MRRSESHQTFRSVLLPLIVLCTLAAGCSDDDSVTGPQASGDPTHYDLTLKMSSIWAIEDCEDTPGNPGEFRYRLILRKPDEFGNQVIVHDTGVKEVVIGDGERQGIVMDPIPFRLPNEPTASFEVEYWIGEYDGATADFENHSWALHRLDRGHDQMWAAGSKYESDRYTENADGSGNGLLKFSVWNERETCKGAAYYYVTWTPAWL